MDLSSPKGLSINDGIAPPLCILRYVTVDEIAAVAATLGCRALIAKLDIESAYRIVAVHPDDRPLLDIQWQSTIYIGAILPFGLQSPPKIFMSIADALKWILRHRSTCLVWHYIDDFIFCGPPASTECARALDSALTACSELGMPVSAHKVLGLATDITVLGIWVNSITQTLSLPDDKLERLQHLLTAWGDKTHCTDRELQSLVGIINHTCRVVRPGRSFIRRMLDLLQRTEPTAARQRHFTRLNLAFRVPTSNGGVCLWQTGTGCLSSQAPGPSLSRWSQMPQTPGGVAPTGTPTGSSSSGQHVSTHCLSQ